MIWKQTWKLKHAPPKPRFQIYFSNLFDGRQYTLLVLLAKAECNIVLLNLDNENLSHPKV